MRPLSSQPCLDTSLVGRRRRFVYAYVPKAACTSLKLWMAAVEELAPALHSRQQQDGIHRLVEERAALRKLSRREAAAILADPQWFKFTFVRHPLTRLVSAYLDKVVPAKSTAQELIRNFQRRLPETPWWQRLAIEMPIDAERSLTFREMVEQLLREPRQRLDVHFRPQSLLLAGLPLDFVGRVENITEEFAAVQQRLGTCVPLGHKKQQSYAGQPAGEYVADWPAAAFRSGKAHPHWRRFYPPELVAAVVDYYSDDFSRFGYRASLDDVAASPVRRAA
jgi:hypothetical protein